MQATIQGAWLPGGSRLFQVDSSDSAAQENPAWLFPNVLQHFNLPFSAANLQKQFLPGTLRDDISDSHLLQLRYQQQEVHKLMKIEQITPEWKK